jgi:cytoskeletal protein RodZ
MAQPLGQKLKAAREQRGLSLLDASHVTKIPVRRLHYLETDDFAGFGSLTYARAFLRQYSAFLKVSADEILNDLPVGALGGPRDYRYLTENHGTWVAPRGACLGRLSDAPARRHTRKSPVPAGLCIFFLVLVGTGIWGKYVAEEHTSESQQVIEVKEFPPISQVPETILPKPMVIQEDQAATLTANAQAIRTPLRTATVLKAVPIVPKKIEKLNVNPAGKAELVE